MIEKILDAHPDIAEALVVNGIVVVVPVGFLTGPEVREILRAELPAEATPTAYAIVARIPTDPAELPALYHFEPPADETERRLAELCRRILDVSEIGVLDDFIEAGGDSLTAVDLVNEVHATFGVELSLEDVFEQGTIRALAKLIPR